MELHYHEEADLIAWSERFDSGWRIVAVQGRADAEAADELEQALRSAIEQHPRVVADFEAVEYISSAGLRAVLQAARAAQERGAEFVVCRLQRQVQKVFDMSGLHHVLRIEGALPC